MPMNVGSALSALSSPTLPTKAAAAAAPGADFGAALEQAVSALGQLGAEADASTMKLAAGEPIDIHEVMLNTEHASLGFSMALQVRNKLVEAYQEVMRMPV
jgi:flagellar hook-basal body complex protein FliE